MNAGPLRPARVLLTLCLFVLTLLATGCGQITTRPTVLVPTATSTLTATFSPTPRPTATPAPYTPAPTATPTVTPTPIVHAIARGETLLAIATKYGVSVAAIQEANGIDDPRLLQVGQQIFVPAPVVAAAVVGDATPTAVSTPLPVTVGQVHFGADAAGGLWALGEVRNPGSEALEGVKVVVSLLDTAGQELAKGETLSQLDVLNVAGRSPFGVYFPNPPADFSSYIVQVTSALPAHIGSYYLDLRASEVTGDGERNHAYHVQGSINNLGPEDAVAVDVNVTLYDALGNVIGFARGVPEHNVIPRGGKTSFSVDVIPLGGPVASSVVIAQGRRAWHSHAFTMTQNSRLSLGFRIIQSITRFLLHLLTRLDVEGIEHLPEHGPAILCPNHVAWTDPVVILAYVRGTTTAFAAEKWEKRFPINLLMRYIGHAIFVQRGEVDRQALGKALEVLKQGGILGVAPEGTRSYSGVLAKGHDGAVYLASRTNACLVPIAIWGHENTFAEWKRLRRPHIFFRVGEPFHLPPEAQRARGSVLPSLTDDLMRRIAAMLPAERRGPYA